MEPEQIQVNQNKPADISVRLISIIIIISIAIGALIANSLKEINYSRDDVKLVPEIKVEEEPNLPSLEDIISDYATSSATSTATSTATTTPVATGKVSSYIEVMGSCGPHFDGGCVSMRSGPGTKYSTVLALRDGVVLKISGQVEAEGRTWYKIAFDEWIRYPERLSKDLYIASDYAKLIQVAADVRTNAPNNKHITIDRSEQMLYAYEGDELFMKVSVSTGLKDTPTPRGNFTIFSKVPTRYMQGPLPGISDQEYDLPGVPWTMYFTADGAAIHGAYWHDNFGKVWSHGCVNLPISAAEKLYKWTPLGTKVLVQD